MMSPLVREREHGSQRGSPNSPIVVAGRRRRGGAPDRASESSQLADVEQQARSRRTGVNECRPARQAPRRRESGRLADERRDLVLTDGAAYSDGEHE